MLATRYTTRMSVRQQVAAGLVITALSGAALSQEAVPLRTFVCPMHTDVRAAEPGECPRCGMKLVVARPASDIRYFLDVRTDPAIPQRAQAVRLQLFVRQGSSGQIVNRFATIHEKPFHLFVVSDDLSEFTHVHPAPQKDGSLHAEITLGDRNRYQLYADFAPEGSVPQFIAHTLLIAGQTGDPAASRPKLASDVRPKRVDDSVIELQLPPGDGLVAGELQAFRLHFRDERSGAPVNDLEPYLGAPAHLLIVSEDLVDAVHSHPAVEFSSKSGPDAVFEAVFPRAGVYRIWMQFQRRGRIGVASFTVAASPPPSGY